MQEERFFSETVSTPSLLCSQLRAKWLLPDTLMQGTEGMRGSAKLYLPKHTGENDADYKVRVSRSVLRNFFKQTVTTFTGKVFSTDPIIEADQQILDMLENCDLTGRHFNVFAREVFQEALVKGISFVLVDYPTTPEGLNLEEERMLGNRPYMVHIKPEQLLGWKTEIKGGIHVLSQARILETTVNTCSTTFLEKTFHRVRVFDRKDNVVSCRIFERYDNQLWALISENVLLGITEIPLVAFYTNRKGFFIGEPPLEDLAYMNVEHFQIRSDQRSALNVASFPVLVATGIPEGTDIEFGPNKMLVSQSSDAKFSFLESGGAHLAAGRSELMDLENSMRSFASQFELSNKQTTATGRAIDAAESSASLKSWSLSFCDFAEELIRLMYVWTGINPTVDYKYITDTDFGIKADDIQEYDVILRAFASGLIPSAVAIEELKRRGLLTSELDMQMDI